MCRQLQMKHTSKRKSCGCGHYCRLSVYACGGASQDASLAEHRALRLAGEQQPARATQWGLGEHGLDWNPKPCFAITSSH